MRIKIVRNAEVVVERVDDDLCLYRPDTSDVAVLNRTAAEIWGLVDGDADTDTITAHLAAAYDRAPHEIAGEVRQLVDDLLTRGFLVAATD